MSSTSRILWKSFGCKKNTFFLYFRLKMPKSKRSYNKSLGECQCETFFMRSKTKWDDVAKSLSLRRLFMCPTFLRPLTSSRSYELIMINIFIGTDFHTMSCCWSAKINFVAYSNSISLWTKSCTNDKRMMPIENTIVLHVCHFELNLMLKNNKEETYSALFDLWQDLKDWIGNWM